MYTYVESAKHFDLKGIVTDEGPREFPWGGGGGRG